VIEENIANDREEKQILNNEIGNLSIEESESADPDARWLDTVVKGVNLK